MLIFFQKPLLESYSNVMSKHMTTLIQDFFVYQYYLTNFTLLYQFNINLLTLPRFFLIKSPTRLYESLQIKQVI